MRSFGIKMGLHCAGAILFFAGMFAGPTLCMAAGSEKNIPVHYPGQEYRIIFNLPDHYPDGFDGVGEIEDLSEERLVIDDTAMPLAPGVTYHAPEPGTASPDMFEPGVLVGYVVGDDGVSIVSLWLVVKPDFSD